MKPCRDDFAFRPARIDAGLKDGRNVDSWGCVIERHRVSLHWRYVRSSSERAITEARTGVSRGLLLTRGQKRGSEQ